MRMEFATEALTVGEFTWWISLFLKSLIIIAIGGTLSHCLCRHISAAKRHAILGGTFIALFALAFGSALGFLGAGLEIRIPVFSSPQAAPPIAKTATPFDEEIVFPPSPVAPEKVNNPPGPAIAGSENITQPEVAERTTEPASSSSGQLTSPPPLFPGWNLLLPFAWIAGTICLLFLSLIRRIVTSRLLKKSALSESESLTQLIGTIATECDFRGRVRIRIHSTTSSPFLHGFFRPTIFVPNDFTDWSENRQRAVLIHELEHARRNDFSFLLFCEIVCALFWINPFVWWAARQMDELQEMACDDAVLSRDGQTAEYSAILIEITRQLLPGKDFTGRNGIAMASRSNLSRRVEAILEPDRDRRPPTGKARGLATFLLLPAIIIGMSGFIFAEAPLSASSDNSGGKLSNSERKHLENILKKARADSLHFPAGIHYRGTLQEGSSGRVKGVWEDFPIPQEFEVWLGGDWENPHFRTDHEPSVSIWTAGAAPFYINNETVFSDGKVSWRLDHSEGGKGKPRIENVNYRKVGAVPGAFYLLTMAPKTGDDLISVEEGYQHKFVDWLATILENTPEENREDKFDFSVEEITYREKPAVRVSISREGNPNREMWWFDPEHHYTLRGWDRLTKLNDENFFQRTLETDNLIDLGGGNWFPGTMECAMAEISGQGRNPRWKRNYRFDLVEKIEAPGKDFFTEKRVTEAIRQKQSENPGPGSKADDSGGIVVDEKGKPITGVKVSLVYRGADGNSTTKEATTDESGRWKMKLSVPENTSFKIRVSHPDFVDDRYGQDFRMRSSQPYSAILDGTAKVVMKTGMRVSGTIVDGDGNPVPNAEIVTVQDRWGANIPDIRTKADGTFQTNPIDFSRLRTPGQLYLTVQAEGFAPQLKVLKAAGSGSILSTGVTLSPPPRKLKARVVYEDGSPAAGVLVIADTWRNQTRTITFRTTTDKDGRFVWNNAPEDAVAFDILGKEITLRDSWLTAGEDEISVVLKPAIQMEGEVVSSRTGDSIEEFTLTRGRKTEADDPAPYWEKSQAREITGGKFTQTGSNLGWVYYLKIEAEGYETFISEGFEARKNEESLRIELKPLD